MKKTWWLMRPLIFVQVMISLMTNFPIELFYRSSILDNITNWRVFKDEKITNFLHSEDTFKGLTIDDEQHETLL